MSINVSKLRTTKSRRHSPPYFTLFRGGNLGGSLPQYASHPFGLAGFEPATTCPPRQENRVRRGSLTHLRLPKCLDDRDSVSGRTCPNYYGLSYLGGVTGVMFMCPQSSEKREVLATKGEHQRIVLRDRISRDTSIYDTPTGHRLSLGWGPCRGVSESRY